MPNFPELFTKNEVQIGTFLTFPSVHSAQVMSQLGFAFLIVDGEHNPLSPQDWTHIVHAVASASHGRVVPLVRIPAPGVEYVKWGLDSGAAGIVIPMVQTRAEMESVVRYGRYPPLGQRSFGPAKDVAIIPMIESAQGVENCDEILSVKGISGVFVGSSDLRLSLGLMGPDGTEEVFLSALQKIADTGKKYGLPVGAWVPHSAAVERNKKFGFTWFSVGSDGACIAQGGAQLLKDASAASKI
ncbi:Phosphoenolpyruvate/pyruvate domain-containing protein [Rhizodiscina lignyota]|uniref:Phosphoenolpyruvate/pyruvate domain-containing protein n=1 Tax=Rhizodiscina lignyota TaxID=1504668 RepID=A0A9P4IPF1_9PEZI|nr:Phosphoenolpyruvate/pyruvate domain-containing protein [Rhizodiscina lignyota]